MPIVTVELTREGTQPGLDRMTTDQKAAIIKGMSEVLRDVLGKPLDWTWVLIREVELEDWGWGGLPVMEYRARLAGKAE